MMKMLIANWKASLTLQEINIWLDDFKKLLQTNPSLQTAMTNKEIAIVICPPFPFLLTVKEALKEIQGIHVGSQTISTKTEGKYTGEVTAKALKGIISYAIIAHSERRTHFLTTEVNIEKKISNCIQHSIDPILCVRNEDDKTYSEASYVAYEPVDAIGSGHNADVNLVLDMKKKLKLNPDITFLYGGSVDENNVATYLETGEIQGFLVGTASLKASSFYNLAVAMI